MILEVHILQNFAPSNLNRDDTGAPKDCEFGGYRRARISSQCLKRAMRETMRASALLPPEDLARRTKRLVEEVGRRLVAAGRDEQEARAVIIAALAAAGLKVEANQKTQYLLFLGEREIANLVALCAEHWDALLAVGQAADEGAKGGGRAAKKAKPVAGSPAIGDALKRLLDGGRAADLALFGRMIADLPDRNVDGACQVAHALSTNSVSVEFDFYTAVDDLQTDDTTGADMLGTIEFNSACYYRYANVDVARLEANLQGDSELTRRTVEAFLRAAITAVPSGKQNSMAAQNPPSLVCVVARRTGLWSLANAFVQPVRAGGAGDLVAQSMVRLDAHWGRLTRMYGADQITGAWVCSLDDTPLPNLTPAGSNTKTVGVESVDRLVAGALGALSSGVAA